jgi:hypothetical protein
MVLYIKIFLCISLLAVCNTSMGKENSSLSLLDIHKLRSAKIAKSRAFYGKEILIKRFGSKSGLLANNVADMANRVGCGPNMKMAAKRVLGEKSKKHSKAISTACEVKNREK